MSKNLKYLINAVESRGFAVRRLDYYVWSVNGSRLVFDDFIKACRGIIKKYNPRQDLYNVLQRGC